MHISHLLCTRENLSKFCLSYIWYQRKLPLLYLGCTSYLLYYSASRPSSARVVPRIFCFMMALAWASSKYLVREYSLRVERHLWTKSNVSCYFGESCDFFYNKRKYIATIFIIAWIPKFTVVIERVLCKVASYYPQFKIYFLHELQRKILWLVGC